MQDYLCFFKLNMRLCRCFLIEIINKQALIAFLLVR